MAFPNGNKEVGDELLSAQSLIWNHLFNFINSYSLKCAIQLGIPDAIHNHHNPMPLALLVDALSINKAKSACLQRLMRLLVHSGFFIEMPEGYVLTPASHLLLKDNPFSIAPSFETLLDPIVTQPWNQFSSWFQTEGHASLFESFHGSPVWQFTAKEHKFNDLFNEAMASDARLMSRIVVSECKQVFSGVDSLVDVGGGTGTMAKVIAEAFPNISCIVLDLPHVIEGLKGSSNLSFVGGDMFVSLPATNAVLLKWILHDWPDEKCVEILKRCKDALTNKGKVIIIDIVVNQETKDVEVETQLFYDIHMMTGFNGKERNESEWAKLFFEAGFINYKITHKLGVRSLIEVYM